MFKGIPIKKSCGHLVDLIPEGFYHILGHPGSFVDELPGVCVDPGRNVFAVDSPESRQVFKGHVAFVKAVRSHGIVCQRGHLLQVVSRPGGQPLHEALLGIAA